LGGNGKAYGFIMLQMKMYGDGYYLAMKGETNDNELNSSTNNI
jgi:hypothetical protein